MLFCPRPHHYYFVQVSARVLILLSLFGRILTAKPHYRYSYDTIDIFQKLSDYYASFTWINPVEWRQARWPPEEVWGEVCDHRGRRRSGFMKEESPQHALKTLYWIWHIVYSTLLYFIKTRQGSPGRWLETLPLLLPLCWYTPLKLWWPYWSYCH